MVKVAPRKEVVRKYRSYRDYLNDRGVPDTVVVQRDTLPPAPPPSTKVPKPQ